MAHVAIITGAHLCRNPRVVKEAMALAAAGYEVRVLGPAIDDGLRAEDARLAASGGFAHTVAVDLRASAGAARHRHRLVRRLGTEAVARLGWQRPEALGYGMHAMLRAARRTNADLTIGHQEVGLWVAHRLAREGKRIGVDMEDWYSRDLLPEARARLPIGLLARLERDVLRHATHATTTSEALASALARAYEIPAPHVLYNAFPWADRQALGGPDEDRPDHSRPSLHWVSQTVGPGRGLDTLCDALARLDTAVDVHVRGHAPPTEAKWLRGRFPSEHGHRLFLHGLVPPTALLARIAEHDVGLALEPRDPPNTDLTVSNKILHYLLGGLAVVATNTSGQREVAARAPAAVRLCEVGCADSLAEVLHGIVQPAVLAHARAAALRVAQVQFSWEQQVPILLESVGRALAPARTVSAPPRSHVPR